MGIEDFLPCHVVVHRKKSSIWKTRSVVRGSLKPQLEISFQNPNTKAIPAKILFGLLHIVNLQILKLGKSFDGQNVDFLKIDHHLPVRGSHRPSGRIPETSTEMVR